MPAIESALLTASDYRRLTPEFPLGPRYQLVEGELSQMSAPNRFHQEISGNLHLIIGNYLRLHPVGVVYAAPFDVYLDEHNVFQPDLLFVSRERAAILVPEGVSGAPDLVVEILSASTAAVDRRQKRHVYARAGAAELWLIEPELRTVELSAFGRDAEHPAAVFGGGTGKDFFETPLLPGLRIVLAEIFASRLG
jgi:Uma2 family endonuclease